MQPRISYPACSPERILMSEPAIQRDVSLRQFTTFKCGGPARYFAEPSSEEELVKLLAFAKESGLETFILGLGSNILVSDEGFDGLVIRIGRDLGGISVEEDDSGAFITAGAGAPLSLLGNTAVKHGLEGAEFCCGIPGSVGGAVYMNAGAYGREIKDIAVSVKCLEDGVIKTVAAEDCMFGYRTSLFEQKEEECIILGLTVRLAKGDPEKIAAYVEELKTKRTTSQPLDVPSAGSTFKRPEGYFAGKLIDDSGLRGFKLDESGAQVSPKHCGFVVNNGGTASAADVLRLIRYVQDTVLEKQGVKIEPEVRLIGKFNGEKGDRSWKSFS